MQKQLKLVLLFTVASFILFTGFKRDNPVSSSIDRNAKRTPVTIIGVYDFSTFPNVWGTFTTSGALTISGTTSMDIGFNSNGSSARCVVVLYATDGIITIHQECQVVTSPWKGRWEIVSGTGAYANLRGNGLVLMPPNTEAMTGVIY
jgi:hypothetical protein